MGLKGDFEEIATLWTSAPWRVRLYLALSGFLASTSIAAISDTIVKWKGFFKTGVVFYRENLSAPLQHVAEAVSGLSPPKDFSDYALVQTLVIATALRLIFLSQAHDRKRILWVLAAIATLLLSWLALFLLPRPEKPASPVSVYLLCVTLLIGGTKRATRLLALIWLLMPPLLVGLAAAINLGLNS